MKHRLTDAVELAARLLQQVAEGGDVHVALLRAQPLHSERPEVGAHPHGHHHHHAPRPPAGPRHELHRGRAVRLEEGARHPKELALGGVLAQLRDVRPPVHGPRLHPQHHGLCPPLHRPRVLPPPAPRTPAVTPLRPCATRRASALHRLACPSPTLHPGPLHLRGGGAGTQSGPARLAQGPARASRNGAAMTGGGRGTWTATPLSEVVLRKPNSV
jgi:hypothetical protein